MPKLPFSSIILGFLVLNIMLLSYVNVLACSCTVPLICEQYSSANSVFIGKLERLEKTSQSPFNDTFAYFSVEKIYKGKTAKTELIKFSTGSCERELIVGEKYFVYKEVSELPNPCNRTALLSQSYNDLEYAETLSETNPIFKIHGKIEDLSDEDIKNSEIWIELEQSKLKANLDKYGNFEYIAKTKGLYHIKMTLPFDAKIQMRMRGGEFEEGNGFKVSRTDKQTIIEYDLEFKPNSCSYRQIIFLKKDYKRVQNRD